MSSAALKWMALVAMLIDHIAMFIPGMPVGMRWIGRLAAPLFMFCLIHSVEHTRSRVKLLARLYVAGLIMGIVNFGMQFVIKNPYEPMVNNFFTTLFLIGLICTMIEYYKEDKASAKQMLVVAAVVEVISILICFLAGSIQPALHLDYIFQALMPNVIYTEGGFLFIIFGVFMYVYRHEKKYMVSRYALFCFVYAVIAYIDGGSSLKTLFFGDYQWMMVIAAPFMLLYNGQKGRSPKYLFYVFYPLHIWILFLVGNM